MPCSFSLVSCALAAAVQTACPVFDGSRTYFCDQKGPGHEVVAPEVFRLQIVPGQGGAYRILSDGVSQDVVADGQPRDARIGGRTVPTSASCGGNSRLQVRVPKANGETAVGEFYPEGGGIAVWKYTEKGGQRSPITVYSCHFPSRSRR